MEILTHPAFGALVFTLLCLWPLARIFRRSGRSPWLSLLFLPGAALPFTGFILIGTAFLVVKPKAMSLP